MKVGFCMFATPDTARPATIAAKLESLGFDSYWLPEHPTFPVHYETHYGFAADGKIPDHYGCMPDSLIGLASAAGVTETLRLATGICLVTQRDPLLLAKEVATLDHLSGGRVVFGVGAGWLREEAEIFGTDFATRWRRLRESVEAMRALWRDGEAEYHGEEIDFPAVRCLPQPAQRPGPPVVLGTYAYDERSLRRVAAWADGWCPPATTPDALKDSLALLGPMLDEAGRRRDDLEISVLLGVDEHSDCADLIRRYEDAGADRVAVMPGEGEGVVAALAPRFIRPDEVDAVLEPLAERSLVRSG